MEEEENEKDGMMGDTAKQGRERRKEEWEKEENKGSDKRQEGEQGKKQNK